jgi:hypothetical protein
VLSKSVQTPSKNEAYETHVKIILEVTLAFLAWDRVLDVSVLLLKEVAGRDGDGGTTSSECESSCGIGSICFSGEAGVSIATSRTSFMPARTLTRPEMASTVDESWTWLSCSVFTASSSSLRIADWSGVGEAMLMDNVLVGDG